MTRTWSRPRLAAGGHVRLGDFPVSQTSRTLQSGSISALSGSIAAGQSATVTIVVLPSQPAPAPAGLVHECRGFGRRFQSRSRRNHGHDLDSRIAIGRPLRDFRPRPRQRGGRQEPDVDRDGEQPWTIHGHRRERSVATRGRSATSFRCPAFLCRRPSRFNPNYFRPSWAHSRRVPARRSPSSWNRCPPDRRPGRP